VDIRGSGSHVFRRLVDSNQLSSEPHAHWHVDLSSYVEKPSHWRSALPRYINQAWLARVGYLRLEPCGRRERSVNRVYSAGADLRDRAASPRAFLVQGVVPVDGIDAAVKLMDRGVFESVEDRRS